MNNLLKQCLWQISFQYNFDKLLSLLYEVFKSTIKLKKWGQNENLVFYIQQRHTLTCYKNVNL